MAYVRSDGTVTITKSYVQMLKDTFWGTVNFVFTFFSTFSPSRRVERRDGAMERRARYGGGGSGSGGGGGGGGGARNRNIHGVRQTSSVTVPGGGCCGSSCG